MGLQGEAASPAPGCDFAQGTVHTQTGDEARELVWAPGRVAPDPPTDPVFHLCFLVAACGARGQSLSAGGALLVPIGLLRGRPVLRQLLPTARDTASACSDRGRESRLGHSSAMTPATAAPSPTYG